MFHGYSVRRLIALLIVALLIMPLLPAAAQTTSLQAPVPAHYQALLDKAQTTGTLRVIVGVKLPKIFQPEGNLGSPQAVDEQRNAIYTAQQALLDSLKGFAVTVNARYIYIPFLALTVDEAALKAVTSSPLVTGVQEDIAVPPTLASSVPVIGADNVWDAGYNGAGWAVAVIDTGVQWDHPFLGGSGSSRVVSEACYSQCGGAVAM